MLGDLQNPKWMYLKAALFVLLGCLSAGLLLAQSPTVQTAALLALTIWAFARAYYFAFYVIQHYIDDQFRFAGLWHLARYILGRRRQ